MGAIRVVVFLGFVAGAFGARLLPQALEDVHRFVQKELLNRRSHGKWTLSCFLLTVLK